MLSVFDRIKNALAEGKTLAKTELFKEANIPNTKSNRSLFEILLQNGKLIPIGKGRLRKYCLPYIFDVFTLPENGLYRFQQKGDGEIHMLFNEEHVITFSSYDECATFIRRRFTNG